MHPLGSQCREQPRLGVGVLHGRALARAGATLYDCPSAWSPRSLLPVGTVCQASVRATVGPQAPALMASATVVP